MVQRSNDKEKFKFMCITMNNHESTFKMNFTLMFVLVVKVDKPFGTFYFKVGYWTNASS